MVNDIQVRNPDPSQDKEWREIVEKIVRELDNKDLPSKVVRATEYLLSGYTVNDAASELDVAPKTVRKWLTKYPTIAMVLANNRKYLIKWRMTEC